MLIFLIFSLCSICFVGAVLGESNTKRQINEQQILKKVFHEGQILTSLAPDTLTYLEDLKNFYLSEPSKVVAPAETRELVLELSKLPEQTKCFDEDVLENFERLYREEANYANIVNFIKYCRHWYIRKCKGKFSDAYFKSVLAMPSSTANKLYELVKEVIRLSEDRPHYYKLFYSEDALVDGVYNTIEREISTTDETTSISTWEEFQKLYKLKIVLLCESLGNDFKKVAENFLKRTVFNPLSIRTFDALSGQRIKIASVCYDIENNQGKVMDKVWKLVKQNGLPTVQSS